MKIGDYVRTIDEISKITDIRYNNRLGNLVLTEDYNYIWYKEREIIKSSPNIIDLIEVGDYVNGSLVLSIYNEPYEKKEKVLRIERTIPSDSIYGDDCELIYNNEIKSIVTKEQFASMEYKVVN